MAAIRKSNGRFLERSKDLQSWYDIGDAKATEKTSQALREGQPKLRKRMIDHGIIANDFQSCSTEHMISLLPTASANQIDPNPVLIGDDSYSSVDKNDISKDKVEQQRSMLEQSLNDRHAIGNCHFHPTDCASGNRIVTPPTTPPNYPQQVEKIQIDNNVFACPFPNNIDFDDSNSIMTFEMDEDECHEMIDDDDESIFPMSTPSPPLTNHFRALNELKDNVPIYDKSDQPMFSGAPSTNMSSISNHLRALTELKGQVPIYNNECQGHHQLNNSCQFNGNFSQNPEHNLNASCSSMEVVPNLMYPMQVNY